MAVCPKKKEEKKSGRNGLAETQPIFLQATTTHQLRSWQRTPSPHPNLWLSLTLHPSFLSLPSFHTHARKNGNASKKQNNNKKKKTTLLQPRKNFLKFAKPGFWQSRRSFPEAPKPLVSRENFHAEPASEPAHSLTLEQLRTQRRVAALRQQGTREGNFQI